MTKRRKDPAFTAIAASLPPGASDFMDFTMEKLYPHAIRCAVKMGFTPGEAQEAALRVVQAANGQLISAVRRAKMRAQAKAGTLLVGP
jgi:GTP cyclohydrolase III